MQKKLLLHTCCAPCLSGCLHQLPDGYSLTSYFYNPNITLSDEYNLRLDELRRFSVLAGFDYIDDRTDEYGWMNQIRPLKDLGERSRRCEVCYRIRLEQTCRFARDKGYTMFGTTLTLSPHKMTDVINRIGLELAQEYRISYLVSDFKKRDGYRISIESSKKYSFYRQDYCGCMFSKMEREKVRGKNRSA